MLATAQLPERTYGLSSMYKIPVGEEMQWSSVKTDYMQLGYLLAFALDT